MTQPLSSSTPSDKADAALARISQVDGDLKAFVATLPEIAQANAAASTARWASGQQIGPLDGMPFAVKDNIAVGGLPTHSGTMAFATPAQAGVVF